MNNKSIAFPFAKGLLVIVWACFASQLIASHNYAGYISCREIGPNQIEITLTTYSDPAPAFVDRCAVDLEIWSFPAGISPIATLTDIPRVNGPLNVDPLFPTTVTCPGQNMGEYIRTTFKKNVYQVLYTVPGPGSYLVRYSDLARPDNINNMTNSGNQAYYLETFFGYASGLENTFTPILDNHMVDNGCAGEVWTYNPGIYESEGDSLVWEFTSAWQYDPPAIPTPILTSNWVAPDNFGNNGPLSIDHQNGFIRWESPQDPGIYVIAYHCKEYRNGILIGKTHFDHAVIINPCNNAPPGFVGITEIEVTPGDTAFIPFKVGDGNPLDSIYLELNNLQLGLDNPVNLSPAATVDLLPTLSQTFIGMDTLQGMITWPTNASLARFRPYQIDLYAQDNMSYDSLASATRAVGHHAIRIFVRQPVGREEPALPIPLELHPNPSQGEFHLRISEPGEYEIAVYSPMGAQLSSVRSRELNHELALSDLPNGVYFLRVQGKGRSAVKKLILLR